MGWIPPCITFRLQGQLLHGVGCRHAPHAGVSRFCLHLARCALLTRPSTSSQHPEVLRVGLCGADTARGLQVGRDSRASRHGCLALGLNARCRPGSRQMGLNAGARGRCGRAYAQAQPLG